MNQWKLLKAFKFYNSSGDTIQGAIDDIVFKRGFVFTLNGKRIIATSNFFFKNPDKFQSENVFEVTTISRNVSLKKITLTFNILPTKSNAIIKQAITDLMNRM